MLESNSRTIKLSDIKCATINQNVYELLDLIEFIWQHRNEQTDRYDKEVSEKIEKIRANNTKYF